jgi:hypothetical protein
MLNYSQYDFEIQNVTMAPDGFEKFMLIVNGQFPGPVRTTRVVQYDMRLTSLDHRV